MAKMFINDSTLTAIADAIRAKTETSETMLPGEMAALITAIETGATSTLQEGTFTVANNAQTASLGASVNVSGDYLLYAYTTDSGSNSKYTAIKGVRISRINGSKTAKTETMSTSGTASSTTGATATISSSGTLTSSYYFLAGDEFKWVFVSWG